MRVTKRWLRVILLCASLPFLNSCALTRLLGGPDHPPDVSPAQMDVVSQDPQSWYILYSSGTSDHPSAPPSMWAISLPHDGHVNYLESPFRTATRPQQIVLTFQVDESPDAIPVTDSASSPCRDHNPCTPVAEFHVLFEQKGDDLSKETGRWWYKPGFRITNLSNDSYDAQPFVADGQPHTISIPLTADMWTSVNGRGTANDFESALKNVGYVGITFGGSDFFGHGVWVTQGTVQFQMSSFTVE